MACYHLTKQATTDLTDIYLYTFRTFGEEEAESYVDDMYECIGLIAENSRLGRAIGFVRPGVSRFAHREHPIFYKPESEGVLIIRFLHSRMDPSGRL